MALPIFTTAPTGTWSGLWSDAATWGGTGVIPAGHYPGKPYAVAGCAASPTSNGAGGFLIRVTLGSAAPSGTGGWADGDQLVLDGVVGTTEANGIFTATKISATAWDLQGSTFTNAYVSGGSAVRAEGVLLASGSAGILTQDVPVKLGDYGVSAYSLQVGGGMTLFNSGVALTLRCSPYWAAGSSANFSPGFDLVLDTGAAGAGFNFGIGTNLTMGSSGTATRSTVRRASGSVASVGMGGFNGTNPNLHCYAVDFSDMGASSGSWWLLPSGSSTATVIDDCTFTRCGLITTNPADETCNFRLTNSRWSGTVYSEAVYFYFNNTLPNGSPGARVVTGNGFDKVVIFQSGYAGVTLNGNVFDNAYGANVTTGTSLNWASFDGNLFRDTNISWSPVAGGDATNNYIVKDNALGNNHFLVAAPGTSTVDGNVFESPFADGLAAGADPDLGDCSEVTGQGTVSDTTFRRNLYLPIYPGNGLDYDPAFGTFHTRGLAAGTMITVAGGSGGAVVRMAHNTIYGGNPRAFIRAPEGGTIPAGTVPQIQANLFVVPNAFSGSGTKVVDADHVCPDAVTAAGANHNGYNNLGFTGTALYDVSFTTTTGLAAGDVHADPQFVDPARNILRWAVAKGHTTTTSPATLADWNAVMVDARAALRADPALIADLISWVRAGFRPTNPAFAGATYSGDTLTTDAAGNPLNGTVGAMAYQAPAVPGRLIIHTASGDLRLTA